uniref:Uncharacterized protein n=1 Tax=Romanomermis culicivorax TaxID=13658 RepID=A0A915IX72_ROMCU
RPLSPEIWELLTPAQKNWSDPPPDLGAPLHSNRYRRDPLPEATGSSVPEFRGLLKLINCHENRIELGPITMATLVVEQDSEAEPAAVSSSGYVEEEETNRSTIIKTENSYEMNNNGERKNCLNIKSLNNTKILNGHCENSNVLDDEKPEILSSTTTNISASSSTKIQQQQMESSRRENLLVMRLTTKEQEVQEYLTQLEELKSNITSDGHMKHALLDPAVNLMFQRMKNELEQTKEKLEQSVQEFDAWKFTPD